MINLGFYSGKQMPNVKLPRSVADIIIEVWVGIVFLAGLFTTILLLNKSQAILSKTWLEITMLVVLSILALFTHRIPIRYFNFPVRPTERNYKVQYALAIHCAQVVIIIVNLLMLLRIITAGGWFSSNIADILNAVLLCLITTILITYYVYAFRHK